MFFKNFDRKSFYPFRNKLRTSSILDLLSENILDYSFNPNYDIEDISSVEIFRDNSVLFIEKNLKLQKDYGELLVVTDDDILYKNINKQKILIKNIDYSYISIANNLFKHEDSLDFHDEYILKNNSYISKYSKIDDSAIIMNNCTIGRGVEIGKECIIKNNVVIKNSIIKDNVIIGDNSIIGSSGFGFNIRSPGTTNFLPHIGIVYIDDNTTIGSSCTIDRGKIDLTYIGSNCMIDNLVHIAHNVVIKDNAIIAAQTGVSGSVFIDENLICGGQSGFAGHIKVGKNVTVAGKSGVTKNIKNKSTVAGFPAIDIKSWKKNIINIRKKKKNGY